MYHQYAPFFAEFQHKLTQGGSLLYTWDIGLGVNFSALYAYYLASPFSFITLLFPENQLPEALMWLTCIKIGLAGMSFALFLRLAFNKRPWAILLFACC